MSFLGMKELEILAKDCIEPFDPKRLKNASYELSLGNQAYVTDSKSQKIDYLESLKRGELASPNVLLDRIKSNEATLKNWLWAAGIIIGLCIAITLKLYMDSSKFENGYIVGVKEKAIKEGIDSAYKKSNMDSIISNKVDSILKTKKTIIQGKP